MSLLNPLGRHEIHGQGPLVHDTPDARLTHRHMMKDIELLRTLWGGLCAAARAAATAASPLRPTAWADPIHGLGGLAGKQSVQNTDEAAECSAVAAALTQGLGDRRAEGLRAVTWGWDCAEGASQNAAITHQGECAHADQGAQVAFVRSRRRLVAPGVHVVRWRVSCLDPGVHVGVCPSDVDDFRHYLEEVCGLLWRPDGQLFRLGSAECIALVAPYSKGDVPQMRVHVPSGAIEVRLNGHLLAEVPPQRLSVVPLAPYALFTRGGGCTLTLLRPHRGGHMRALRAASALERAVMAGHDRYVIRQQKDQAPEGVVTLAFTDVQSSTSLWEASESTMRMALTQHNEILRAQIAANNGYEVKTEGDAFMVAFRSVVDAFGWGMGIQRELVKYPWPGALPTGGDGAAEAAVAELPLPPETGGGYLFRGVRVRCGLHTGVPDCRRDPVTGRMDYFGPMVNLAARVSGVGKGGECVLSSAAFRALKREGVLPSGDYACRFRGASKLKGVAEEEGIYTCLPAALEGRFDHWGIAPGGLPSPLSPRSPRSARSASPEPAASPAPAAAPMPAPASPPRARIPRRLKLCVQRLEESCMAVRDACAVTGAAPPVPVPRGSHVVVAALAPCCAPGSSQVVWGSPPWRTVFDAAAAEAALCGGAIGAGARDADELPYLICVFWRLESCVQWAVALQFALMRQAWPKELLRSPEHAPLHDFESGRRIFRGVSARIGLAEGPGAQNYGVPLAAVSEPDGDAEMAPVVRAALVALGFAAGGELVAPLRLQGCIDAGLLQGLSVAPSDAASGSMLSVLPQVLAHRREVWSRHPELAGPAARREGTEADPDAQVPQLCPVPLRLNRSGSQGAGLPGRGAPSPPSSPPRGSPLGAPPGRRSVARPLSAGNRPTNLDSGEIDGSSFSRVETVASGFSSPKDTKLIRSPPALDTRRASPQRLSFSGLPGQVGQPPLKIPGVAPFEHSLRTTSPRRRSQAGSSPRSSIYVLHAGPAQLAATAAALGVAVGCAADPGTPRLRLAGDFGCQACPACGYDPADPWSVAALDSSAAAGQSSSSASPARSCSGDRRRRADATRERMRRRRDQRARNKKVNVVTAELPKKRPGHGAEGPTAVTEAVVALRLCAMALAHCAARCCPEPAADMVFTAADRLLSAVAGGNQRKQHRPRTPPRVKLLASALSVAGGTQAAAAAAEGSSPRRLQGVAGACWAPVAPPHQWAAPELRALAGAADNLRRALDTAGAPGPLPASAMLPGPVAPLRALPPVAKADAGENAGREESGKPEPKERRVASSARQRLEQRGKLPVKIVDKVRSPPAAAGARKPPPAAPPAAPPALPPQSTPPEARKTAAEQDSTNLVAPDWPVASPQRRGKGGDFQTWFSSEQSDDPQPRPATALQPGSAGTASRGGAGPRPQTAAPASGRGRALGGDNFLLPPG